MSVDIGTTGSCFDSRLKPNLVVRAFQIESGFFAIIKDTVPPMKGFERNNALG